MATRTELGQAFPRVDKHCTDRDNACVAVALTPFPVAVDNQDATCCMLCQVWKNPSKNSWSMQLTTN